MTVAITPEYVVDCVNRGRDSFRSRWDLIKKWRDVRYGVSGTVIAQIPTELQTTNYEYFDQTLTESIFDLTAFLASASPVFTMPSARRVNASKANLIEAILTEVFREGGVLAEEGDHTVQWSVFQNQVESGHGIYKLYLKRDYPLSMPQREYSDETKPDFEENPSYKPKSPKLGRAERAESKYRESDSRLKQRRDKFFEEEFAFAWDSVDPATYFRIEQNGRTIADGEISTRSATLLNEHGMSEYAKSSEGWVYKMGAMGRARPEGSASDGGPGMMVDTFELWTKTRGYFGFISQRGVGELSKPRIELSESPEASWVNALGRSPYFHAYGRRSTEPDNAGMLHGAFDGLITETQLLNYLETFHFNMAHRQNFPLYQPERDPSFAGAAPPIGAEQNVVVSQDEMQTRDLPIGWRWVPINPGVPVDLYQQLAASRERIKENALAAVLRGMSPGAGDSGAKIAMLTDAAGRSVSVFVKQNQIALSEMASCMLETSKRMGITLCIDYQSRDRKTGAVSTKSVDLKPGDIIGTKVKAKLDVSLPIDRAAMESRGLALMGSGRISYTNGAPEYLNISSPEEEQELIDFERRMPAMDELAFQTAAAQFKLVAPSIFAPIIGVLESTVMPPNNTVAGGPNGPYGGATALLARGDAALPGATQVEAPPRAAPI